MATATATKTKVNLQPLDNRVVVERDDSEEKTRGGIVLLDTAKEKAARGKVLNVGPGKLCDKGERTPLQVMLAKHRIGLSHLFASAIID